MLWLAVLFEIFDIDNRFIKISCVSLFLQSLASVCLTSLRNIKHDAFSVVKWLSRCMHMFYMVANNEALAITIMILLKSLKLAS